MDAKAILKNLMPLHPVRLLYLCLALAIAINPVFGQEKSGSLNGVTFDDSGAVLRGVAVTIRNQVTNRTTAAVTGPDGAYVVTNLEPGRYSVKFELPSFSPLNFPEIEILVGQTLKLDARMKVGSCGRS